MNKETLEHISSLMDGELSRETGLFLTRRLSADEELVGTWERYHLIRDCIRQPGIRMPMVDLSQRMRIAILADTAGQEPAGQSSQSLTSRRWFKPVSGFAIAATVALMAIVAIEPGQVQQGSDIASTPAVQPFSSPNVLPTSPNSQPASYSPQSQRRNTKLNSYLVRHNQLVGSVNSQGFLAFVPLISNATPEELAAEDPAVEAEKATETE